MSDAPQLRVLVFGVSGAPGCGVTGRQAGQAYKAL